MGNTCKPMAVSFQCMTKSTTNKKKLKNEKKKKRRKSALCSVNLVFEVHLSGRYILLGLNSFLPTGT